MKKGFSSEILMEVRKAGEGAADSAAAGRDPKPKPPFRPAEDDSKPILRDPILTYYPIETEQAVLRLPPFPRTNGRF